MEEEVVEEMVVEVDHNYFEPAPGPRAEPPKEPADPKRKKMYAMLVSYHI